MGGYRDLIVLIDKFTKWIEVEPVRSITALAAVKVLKGVVSWFGVPNRMITDLGTQFTSGMFELTVPRWARGYATHPWHTQGATARSSAPTRRCYAASRRKTLTG